MMRTDESFVRGMTGLIILLLALLAAGRGKKGRKR
jgi:hypothetical protein